MTWQVSLALRGDLQAFLDAEVKGGKAAVTTIIKRRATNLKNNLRRQVLRAGLGVRLGKTIQSNVYPKRGTSLNAAGLVRSKALYKRPGGLVDLITVLDEATTVRAGVGKALAIPLPAAGRGRGVKNDPVSRKPSDWPAGTFAFIPNKDGKTALLIFKSGPRKGQAAFILVKHVRFKKRINIEKAYAKAIRNIDDAVVAQWERNSTKAEQRFGVDI